jgi:hypothetical protein
MAEALFSFDDASDARRAAQRVAEQLPDASVVLHGNGAPNERLSKKVDEAVSGGLLTNLYTLFEGVFDWQAAPHGAGDYQETIAKGGAVVRINADTAQAQQQVEALMRDCGCTRKTSWADPA